MNLENFKGKWLILYFYPRDNTPGCTLEAHEFTRLKGEFEELNAVIVGVSPNSPESHEKFRKKHKLTINLVSDPDHSLLEKFGVWKPKKFMGREFLGVERSTFIIDPKSNIAKEFRKVRAPGHAKKVLEALKDIQNIK